ncbi:MAG: PIN domain-containing protein [Selenomonadaceae bacterium]|nr:PIN domain-containing protein [Selenomonadaceae bacterium]
MHKILVDTNIILRCLLRDNEEQAKQADKVIKDGAWTLPEVLAEVDHVLRTFYDVERKDIAAQLFKALNLIEVERPVVMHRAVEIFAETKLDFVDCILAAYHDVEGANVFTFDKKLKKQIEREEK